MKYKILFFVVLLITSVYAETVYVGEVKNVGGRDVVINNIGTTGVIIQVGDVKDLVSLDTTKEIAGIRVKVSYVFYVDEKESRYADVEFSSSITCGDGTCTSGIETQSSCCNDCGCSGGLTCNDNQCGSTHLDKCKSNDDCDDKNEKTFDLCTGTPKFCKNTLVVECTINDDCKDDNSCTTDVCEQNTCYNKAVDGCGSGVKTEVKVDDKKENEIALGELSEIGVEEKPGFFKRLILMIKGWFS